MKKSVYTPPANKDDKPDEEPNWLDTVGAPWMEVKKS